LTFTSSRRFKAIHLSNYRKTHEPQTCKAICRFPGAEVSDLEAEVMTAGRSGSKMFACTGSVMPGVSVKTNSVEMAQC